VSTEDMTVRDEAAHALGRGADRAVEMAGAAPSVEGALDNRLTMLAMRMTYIALSFFFACFYFAVFYLQLVNENALWLPAGINHPATALGVAETALVLLAGLAYFWGQWAGLYRRNFGVLQLGLWIAALLTVVSVVLHIAELHNPGFSIQGGGYVSCFVAIEGVFTVMLFISAIVLLGMANRARLGLFRESGVAVDAFGEFFGWISAVALINFLALYVQPFFPSAG
jgi:heme/copper-type cytochrome/quinol oxidase subunit 3